TSAAGPLQQVPLVRFSLSDDEGLPDAEYQHIAASAPDCIYHLAGVAHAHRCGPAGKVSASAWEVNVQGTQRVAELARRLPSAPRVLFVSSSYVYPAGTVNDLPVSEDAPPNPRGGYGLGKLAAEQHLLSAAAAGQLDCVIARAFQHTGPRQGPAYMLPTWAWQCSRASQRPIWAYNTQARVDVCDVRDVVQAYRLLAKKGTTATVYNVGSGVPRVAGVILARLLELAGTRRTTRSLRTVAKFDPIANPSRLAACTGWRPQIPLDQTLIDTYEYWRGRRLRRERGEKSR
ncbi:MAG: NAD-dependent epimerase/dehydratase family protein, partial [Pirellulales bacterium]